jgi:hypothetical protein
MTASRPGRFGDGLTGAKSELWLRSLGQIDIYDDPGLICPSADAVAAWCIRLKAKEGRKEKL